MYYVYSYTKPGASRPFYIGKGSKTRATDHLKEKRRKTLFYKTLDALLRDGVAPEIQILKRFQYEKEAYDYEVKLINRYGRLDIGTGCLCNHTDGGKKPPERHQLKTRLSTQKASNSVIESFDLEFGWTIKQYHSLNAVKDDGYSPAIVHRVLKKQHPHHKDVGWRFST